MNHPAPIFAFDGFASIGMLWWGALGGIPIMIHLLHKRKYRETTWAAMRFLMEAARKNSRRIRIEQLILLLVRVLILLLLACALAQPYMKSLGSFYQAPDPIHRILVVDTSFSMGHQTDQVTRFERAKAIARRIVSNSQQGDALNLVRIGKIPPRVIVHKPAYEKAEVLEEVKALPQSHEKGDLLAAFRDVSELLNDAKAIKQKEVIFISDFQRESWNQGRGEIHDLFKDIANRASVTFLDVGKTSASNLAVTDFSAAEAFIAVDQPVLLKASIANLGGALVQQQLVELFVDGRLADQQHIALPPGQEVPVEFRYTFKDPGEHPLEIRIQGDQLSIDNTRYLSLPVKSQLKVLLVNGESAKRPSDNATFYAEKALRPDTRNRDWRGITKPTVIPETQLLQTDLSEYDCIILCNIRLFTRMEADKLKPYVETGGGLIICLGDRVLSQQYNEVLYNNGQGVLPVKLKPAVGNAKKPDPDGIFQFDFNPDPDAQSSKMGLNHPIVNPYQGNSGTGLGTTFALRYFPTEPPASNLVTNVLMFNTGDPAILEAPLGQGRVILYTTSVDNKWGAWPIQPQTSFPPLLHESVHFAVAGRWRDRQKQVGEPLAKMVRTMNGTIAIKRPDKQEDTERPPHNAGQFSKITYAKTNLSGMYQLSVKDSSSQDQPEWYAVNVDPQESVLDHIGESELTTERLKGINFQHQTQWQNGPRSAGNSLQERGGLTRWLLKMVLWLVLIELLMAWRFSLGFGLLCGIVVIVLVAETFGQNAWITGVVLSILLSVAGYFAKREITRRSKTVV